MFDVDAAVGGRWKVETPSDPRGNEGHRARRGSRGQDAGREPAQPCAMALARVSSKALKLRRRETGSARCGRARLTRCLSPMPIHRLVDPRAEFGVAAARYGPRTAPPRRRPQSGARPRMWACASTDGGRATAAGGGSRACGGLVTCERGWCFRRERCLLDSARARCESLRRTPRVGRTPRARRRALLHTGGGLHKKDSSAVWARRVRPGAREARRAARAKSP